MLSGEPVFLYSAQVYRRDAQVGSNHMLRHTIMNVWKNLIHEVISL